MFMEPTLLEFTRVKQLGDRTIAQLSDEELNTPLAPGANSVAVIVRHLAGNMRSRWTDFLTSDGEKPDRNRDAEFEVTPLTRADVLTAWDGGWAILFGAIEGLADADLARVVTIRHEPHTVAHAIQRQLAHYAGHVYQIVMIGKCLKGPGWQTLSIPRGASETFNQHMAGAFGQKPPA
jgi:hypothetical protein